MHGVGLLWLPLVAGQNRLKWFTWYGDDAGGSGGPQPGNLAFSRNLTQLDIYAANKSDGRKGLWDIGDGMCGETAWCGQPSTANDTTPCGNVWGEPFCGGPKGPRNGYRNISYPAELVKIANLVKARPHIAGLFLGDEGILLGINENEYCTLANRTRAALDAVGRKDVFVYFNDGPDEMWTAVRWQAEHGNCGDYFSMDSYSDDQEPERYRDYYTKVSPELLPGQGFFTVPGLFWFMARTMPNSYENSLMGKLSGNYKYATTVPALMKSMVGLNPWHWANRPKCAQDWCCRGAQDFHRLADLGRNITKYIVGNATANGLYD